MRRNDPSDDEGRSRFSRPIVDSRRNPTGSRSEEQDYDPDVVQHMGDDALPSNDSFRSAGVPWDEQQSDDEGTGRMPPMDIRKTANASTPTLIDEVELDEEEEMEIALLERERIRQTVRGFTGTDESDLRRTPGAQMYKSNFEQPNMRRTPGASQMHRSSAAHVEPHESSSGAGDASGLGFGLTLSTPVAASPRERDIPNVWEGQPKVHENSSMARPPRAPGSSSRDQRGAFAAPWSLTKNPSLENRAYSPNTLRLTEDLGNLLFEDDEPDLVEDSSRHISQLVFGAESNHSQKQASTAQGATNEKAEEWTAPYFLSMDAPTRVPKSSTGTRGRRGKTDHGVRRARGHERSSRYTEEHQLSNKTGGFLPHAKQPKPVRSVQPPHAAQGFSNKNNEPLGSRTSFNSDDGMSESRGLLHFCGAFVPASKMYDGLFHRPVPSVAPHEPTPPQPQPPEMTMEPAYHSATPVFGAPFYNPVPQQAQLFGSHETTFSSQTTFAPPQSNMFDGGDPAMNNTQLFNFGPPPPQYGEYPMHAGAMHQPPLNFMPGHPHHQQPPVPQFAPPQVWPQPHMGMQYDCAPPMGQPTWAPQGPPMEGWQTNPPFGYPIPPQSANGPSMNMQGPNWSSEMEYPPANMQANPFAPDMQANPFALDMHANPFAMLQQQQSSVQTGAPEQTNRKSDRGKNQPKSSSRRKSQSKDQKTPPKFEFGGKKPSNNNRNKKKQTKGRTTPVPTKSSPSNEDPKLISENDLADAKKAELNETPATRSAFKGFYKKFRAQERLSFEEAEEYAKKVLEDDSLPESIHWKVYLELADLSKRANKFLEARLLYQQVCRLQPYASQGWLEYSKLEEECGNMNTCGRILRAGMDYCEYSENLLTRAIKHEEKTGNLAPARELLARLKHVGIEKVWRTVLEGALLEARAGNDVVARRVLKYLMHHVPWYGPLYLEAYKLEKDLGRSKDALAVVERGLEAIPRYGPLWFGAFRLCEEMDIANKRYDLPQSMAMIQRATDKISKELIWKVHLEAATMLERVAVEYLDDTTKPAAIDTMEQCRKRFAMTILKCPPNLRWKVWLASGRMEVLSGNYDTARRLFKRAQVVVPEKGRAVALLECARLEEFVGDTEVARAILAKSRSVSGNDWKVWLESVHLENRNGNYSRAIELAELGLKLHNGTGRLWASLVQLSHFDKGEAAQFESLKLALNAVPKSGEVWCEGARIHLNPFARTFDHQCARRHLIFATKFTPQYGDGFLEMIRQEMIEQWLAPVATRIWESSQDRLVVNPDGNGHKELVEFVCNVSRDLFSIRDSSKDSGDECTNLDKETVELVRECLNASSSSMDTSHLQLQCANADPNYGPLWFLCRTGPNDTARKVLSRAVELIFNDLKDHSHLYLAAFIRRFAILTAFAEEEKTQSTDSEENKKIAESSAQLEDRAIEALLAAPSLEEIFIVGGKNKEQTQSTDSEENKNIAESAAQLKDRAIEAFRAAPSLEEIFIVGGKNNTNEESMDLLKSTMMIPSDFISGLVALNEQHPVERMSSRERRKALYRTDALFS
jgi:hypothetical protein